jgi:hypothetical protein
MKHWQDQKYDMVIIDEAHFLRNYKTAQSKAIFKLQAERKYALTGTPTVKHPADIYGMTVFSASLNTAREIAQVIRQKNSLADIVVGGPHPTALPKETLSFPEFTHVVVGEGEEALLQFVINVKRSSDSIGAFS